MDASTCPACGQTTLADATCSCWRPDYMTDEAMRVLRLLDAEGQAGRIEAIRTYPRAHRFHLHRLTQPEQSVALGVIDQLTRARFIAPKVIGEAPRFANPVQYDRFEYEITDEGRKAVSAFVEERKRAARRKKEHA